ncbi:Ppx/GppA family phosphatase [Hyphomonas sp. WL0036]|uniref:Ppx/GppA phosphatase family protein n=1 Tax=Hyphomonas sediminis TaxID=2866160 RepID=UPI001C81E1F8|nr:Ppx/GppA phosphatase family protein [Hyphomonas sediminis]MBY9067605.1 Ppx/GppA family phosphatase [Hyphomonas sediminis]
MADKKDRGGPPKRAQARSSTGRPLYAAVDLGTNNCRLLVAEPRGQTFRVVDSHSQIARLGEGLHDTGRLSDAAIDRAIDALQAIRRKLRHHGVGRVRCIATEACRKAENGAEFIHRVHTETGLTFKVIGAKEEARLATIGCHDLLVSPAKSVLVVDIGGGSTELSLMDAETARHRGLKGILDRAPIIDWTSLKMGVVTMSDAFSDQDEVTAWPLMLEKARAIVAAWPALAEVQKRLQADEGYLIGTSGTVTCLAGVHLKLDRYRRDRVDGAWMSQQEGCSTINLLRDLGVEGRAKLPTIGEERAPLMLAGCAITLAVWEAFEGTRLRVADRGLREGLLLSMMYGQPRSRSRRRKGRNNNKPRIQEAPNE